MASNQKYRYPPAPPSGLSTATDNLVGFQLVDGGGLTQGNFEFTTSIVEKVNRKFNVGVFSEPFTLENLELDNIIQSRAIQAKQYRVYPNYDLSNVTNFALYGSLSKRFSSSIINIINFYPAAIEVNTFYTDLSSANTATNISYNEIENETTFQLDVTRFVNPFGIDYSVNSTRNLSLLPYTVSPLRNLTAEYLKYSLFLGTNETEYKFEYFEPSALLSSGNIEITVQGNPFSGNSTYLGNLIIKPSKFNTEVAFDYFDEVEKFLLNRNITPRYTANFKVPRQDNNGRYYIDIASVTWPLDGTWNLDISSLSYGAYLNDLDVIAVDMDSYKTNLISRFLTTGAFKEFDTGDQKIEKVLQIYGRSFDETKKFIDALAYMTSVHYNQTNDIPSELLKNLAQTLGYDTNNSPITNDNFLNSVFGTKNQSIYPGQTKDKTPQEINYEYYKKLILNASYLYRSKGTAKSIRAIMAMVGAPKALLEFNETIYLADGPINMSVFDTEYNALSGGTYSQVTTGLDSTNTYKIQGKTFTALTTSYQIDIVNETRSDYPVDVQGYPSTASATTEYFYEMGSGWFEQTPKHRALQKVDITNSVFTGQNPDVQTVLEPYTYGSKYFDRYTKLPYTTLGYDIIKVNDNLKSWANDSLGLRKSQGAMNAYYSVSDDRLVLNRKNIELYLNMGQGLTYDVWDMSRKYGYPIPFTGLTYPTPSGIDWTVINPKVREKTFTEFAQTFYNNMINVRNRQFTSDGKSSGYITLQSLYWKYLNSQQNVNIPSNQYTYQKMIDFTDGLGDYWIRLVEQVIPASTLWMGGQKMENSAFHRQKVVWRRQRGCEIVPVPCIPCEVMGPLLPYDCIDQTLSCKIYPWDEPSSSGTAESFESILYNQVTSLVSNSGYTTSECNLNTITSQWYVDLRLDSTILVQEVFFTGYGIAGAPTDAQWETALNDKLQYLYQDGLDYSIDGDTITISNSGCMDEFSNKTLYLNIGINITINCG
tara:strand:+ start:5420 stop:8389 length:2970 start_codon:yes stop_codon:yes gene_type:complete